MSFIFFVLWIALSLAFLAMTWRLPSNVSKFIFNHLQNTATYTKNIINPIIAIGNNAIVAIINHEQAL